MKNTINPLKKKFWLFAGAIFALCLALFLNVYFAILPLNQLTSLNFSLSFFPPGISLVSAHVEKSYSFFLYLLYDLILILVEIELLIAITRKINPPLKFGLLSTTLTLVGILLLKFVYKSVILVFTKEAGETSASLLYLFYSRQQVLVFLFFSFLVTFGYLTHAINRIKSLLETFPKEEENEPTQK
ncbi:MAG: hypothetical protein Q8N83_06860 [Ignavibacteria bacterium]|nr:hypothetical protein [Ignavibacteria bacterium]